LKRYIQSKVETLLAKKIISEDVAPDTTLVIDKNENGLYVR
jgi:ATP-dependent Clp protease ATP-binding subunit ClpB